MKKNILFVIITIALVLIFSCPVETIKKTYWKGTIDGNFDEGASFKNKHDIEIYIHNDGTCRVVVIVKWSDNTTSDISMDGKYTLENSNYTFKTEVEDDDDSIRAKMNGVLNTSTSKGSGDIRFKYWSGTPPRGNADWEVSRVY